jgi:alpha-1,2-mannosyltransferase
MGEGMTVASLQAWYLRFSYVPSVMLAVGAAWICLGVTVGAFGNPHGLIDFHTYWRAGDAVLHGASPYPPVDPTVLAGQEQFVYPAPAALLFAAFALLPPAVADVGWYATTLATGLTAFALVGVRDVRVFLTLLCSMWFVHAMYVGTVTPLLVLGLALAWRWRDTAWRGALVLAFIISLKILPVALLVWLWRSGRRAAALRCLVATVALLAGSWAVLGFAGLSTYPETLDLLSRTLAWNGFSVTSLGLALGASFATAKLVATTLAVLVMAAAWRVGRLDERHAFLLCIAAGLIASPIVWVNYFSLVMIAVAIHRPSFSWIWVAPIALGLPSIQSDGNLPSILLWNAVLVLVILACMRGRTRELVPA